MRIQQTGEKIYMDNFIVRWKAKSEPLARVGLTVSSRLGEAVKRNRIKRRLKEVIRLHPLDWENFPYDIVIIPKHKIHKSLFQELVNNWLYVCKKLQYHHDKFFQLSAMTTIKMVQKI